MAKDPEIKHLNLGSRSLKGLLTTTQEWTWKDTTKDTSSTRPTLSSVVLYVALCGSRTGGFSEWRQQPRKTRQTERMSEREVSER